MFNPSKYWGPLQINRVNSSDLASPKMLTLGIAQANLTTFGLSSRRRLHSLNRILGE